MRRISHETYAVVFGVAALGLVTNLLLVVAALPMVALLLTTDPALSWPLLALAMPLCAPAWTAAFTVFAEHQRGGAGVVRAYLRGWRATWRKAMVLGGAASAVLVVVLVDVRMMSDAALGVAVVPVLLVLAVLVAVTAITGLVAISEAPTARLRDVVRAAAVLSLRRWYLSAASLVVLGMQFALFASLPAIGLGITSSAALYLVWANARFTLRPVLDTEPDPAPRSRAQTTAA